MSWRMFSVAFLVALAPVAGEAQQRNGTVCRSNGDCDSGYCYPGPGGYRYCLHERMNCPQPNQHGVRYRDSYSFAGYTCTCSWHHKMLVCNARTALTFEQEVSQEFNRQFIRLLDPQNLMRLF